MRDALGQEHPRAGGPARIVSLVPSLTELLFALDLGEQVVGRTGFCIHPRDAVARVPKVGGTKDVKLEKLLGLEPTHVVLNIDENTRETYEALRGRVPHLVVTQPNAPEDNRALYALLGGIFARDEQARALCAALDEALARIAAARPELPARRVLYLIWREPWMTVAPETYIAATLARVGWETQPRQTAVRYPALDDEALRAASADLCLLSSEPYRFRESHRAELRALLGDGVQVQLIDGEMTSWYGNRAIAGLDYLLALARELANA